MLEIHVFGGNVGESIVIRFPDKRWGLIDHGFSQPSQVTEFLRMQRNQGALDHLEFACLTHPHTDHCRGYKSIVEEFKPTNFWIFGATTQSGLKELVLKNITLKMARKKGIPPEALINDDDSQYVDLYKFLKREHANKILALEPLVGAPKQLYPSIPPSSNSPFSIVAIGPDPSLVGEYWEQLARCFPNGAFVEMEKDPPANLLCPAFILNFGKTRILLGSDVEKSEKNPKHNGWDYILSRWSTEHYASQLVKLSHHGSRNGTPEELLKAVTADGSVHPVGVVTPYKPSKLPQSDFLNHIRPNFLRIDCCLNQSKGLETIKIPKQGQWALRQICDSISKRTPAYGYITYRLDDQGNILSTTYHPEAGEYTAA